MCLSFPNSANMLGCSARGGSLIPTAQVRTNRSGVASVHTPTPLKARVPDAGQFATIFEDHLRAYLLAVIFSSDQKGKQIKHFIWQPALGTWLGSGFCSSQEALAG